MRRSSRLFEIIQVLRRAPAPLPAHAIAAVLEVNKRTVYRDIATLQAMRIPIEGEAGIGYTMRRGFDLPPLMFTADSENDPHGPAADADILDRRYRARRLVRAARRLPAFQA